jgi:hypothetical protein
MATDIETEITTNAAKPQSYSEEGRAVTQRSTGDLIQADLYTQPARNRKRRGMGYTKMGPPGPLADGGGSEVGTGGFGNAGSYP